MKLNKLLLPIVLSIAMICGIAIGTFLNFPFKPISLAESYSNEAKLREVIDFINYQYVDKVDADSLLDLTIDGLLGRLDPHSAYIPQSLVANAEESIQGSFEGIGIEFKIYQDSLVVVHTMEEGPSQLAGIEAGDRILQADGTELFGFDLDSRKIISSLKGESGTSVQLSLFRPGSKEIMNLKVNREAVRVNSVQSAFMINDEIGYIKLLRFSKNTIEEAEEAIISLKAAGANGLILDLRDNPGGLLKAANWVSDQFLEAGQQIVFTIDREQDTSRFSAGNTGLYREGKLAVLINENSASASEIVAGAIQDNDRGWILGKQSFGKGLVQQEMTLTDGSKIRLTTQKYYTPSGRSIQRPYSDYDNQSKAWWSEENKQNSYLTLYGREVYGGGGINPDIIVKSDTGKGINFLYHLALIINFDERAFQYVDENRADLSLFSEDEFIANFQVDVEIMKYFFHRHLDLVLRQEEQTQNLLKDRIKAYIAYNLYGSEAFQRVYYTHDLYIGSAIGILQSDKLLIQP